MHVERGRRKEKHHLHHKKLHIRHLYDSKNGKKRNVEKEFKNHVVNVLPFPKEDIKSYTHHEYRCGGMNENVPHKVEELNACFPVGGIALLDKLYH